MARPRNFKIVVQGTKVSARLGKLVSIGLNIKEVVCPKCHCAEYSDVAQTVQWGFEWNEKWQVSRCKNCQTVYYIEVREENGSERIIAPTCGK